MNGLINIAVALLLGGAVVWTGYTLSTSDRGTDDSAEAEQLAERTLSEMEAQQSDLEAESEAAVEAREDSASVTQEGEEYRPPVLDQDIELAEEETTASGSGETRLADASEAQDRAGEKPEPASPTAGLNSSNRQNGVDKPDSNQFFTENGKKIDKPDDGKYFTEKKRIDKPDVKNFFTEGTRLPENRVAEVKNPCLREDGTPYTGPGTVDNPFADTNPCLAELPPLVAQDVPPEGPTPLPPVEFNNPEEPIEIVQRCEYRPGYTPIRDGEGGGWDTGYGCYGDDPWGGFGPQPTIGGGGSDYAAG